MRRLEASDQHPGTQKPTDTTINNFLDICRRLNNGKPGTFFWELEGEQFNRLQVTTVDPLRKIKKNTKLAAAEFISKRDGNSVTTRYIVFMRKKGIRDVVYEEDSEITRVKKAPKREKLGRRAKKSIKEKYQRSLKRIMKPYVRDFSTVTESEFGDRVKELVELSTRHNIF